MVAVAYLFLFFLTSYKTSLGEGHICSEVNYMCTFLVKFYLMCFEFNSDFYEKKTDF